MHLTHRTPRLRTGVAAVVAIALAFVAGCSDDDDASGASDTPSGVESTTSSTVSPAGDGSSEAPGTDGTDAGATSTSRPELDQAALDRLLPLESEIAELSLVLARSTHPEQVEAVSLTRLREVVLAACHQVALATYEGQSVEIATQAVLATLQGDPTLTGAVPLATTAVGQYLDRGGCPVNGAAEVAQLLLP